MKTLLSILVIAFFCTGCLSSKVRTYGTVVPGEKSMTVPINGILMTDIKDALIKNGWRLQVRRGPDITEGSIGHNTRLSTYNTFNTRYTLSLEENFFDWAIPDFDPCYFYSLSVIDNRSGSEIITMRGKDKRKSIIKNLIRALDGSPR